MAKRGKGLVVNGNSAHIEAADSVLAQSQQRCAFGSFMVRFSGWLFRAHPQRMKNPHGAHLSKERRRAPSGNNGNNGGQYY